MLPRSFLGVLEFSVDQGVGDAFCCPGGATANPGGLGLASRLGWTLLMLPFPVSVVALQCIDFELFQCWGAIEIEQLIFDSLS